MANKNNVRDGQTYYTHGKYSTKRVAQAKAKKLRKAGRRARVEPADGGDWYVLATPAKMKRGSPPARGKKKHRPKSMVETFFDL